MRLKDLALPQAHNEGGDEQLGLAFAVPHALLSPFAPSPLSPCSYPPDLGASTGVPFLAFPLGEFPQGWEVLIVFQRLFLITDQ